MQAAAVYVALVQQGPVWPALCMRDPVHAGRRGRHGAPVATPLVAAPCRQASARAHTTARTSQPAPLGCTYLRALRLPPAATLRLSLVQRALPRAAPPQPASGPCAGPPSRGCLYGHVSGAAALAQRGGRGGLNTDWQRGPQRGAQRCTPPAAAHLPCPPSDLASPIECLSLAQGQSRRSVKARPSWLAPLNRLVHDVTCVAWAVAG